MKSKPVNALTVGVHRNRKLAMSEAYRSMLIRQKWLSNGNSTKNVMFDALLSDGKYLEACLLLLRGDVSRDTLPWPSILRLWKSVIAMHDDDLTKKLIEYFSRADVSDFESLLQEVVYISNSIFAERTIRLLENVSLSLPTGPSIGSTCSCSEEDMSAWKAWRLLLALEEVASMKAAAGTRETVQSMQIETVHAPKMDLLSNEEIFHFSQDSVVLVSQPGTAIGLIGKVTQVTSNRMAIELLTDESKHSNGLFLADSVDCVLLAETRVTFERITNSMRAFYNVSLTDNSQRFCSNLQNILNRPNTAKLCSVKQGCQVDGLTAAQAAAVNLAVSAPLSLIQGPPGTGKTHTLAAIVTAWLKIEKGKILCCADSNAATNNILAALRGEERVYRLSALGRNDPVDEQYLAWLTDTGQTHLVTKYRQALAGTSRGALIGAKRAIEEACVKQALVVVTTLASSRNPILDKYLFTRVIIDEAAQTIEPAVFMAISRGCKRLVLVGDHKQLPPVVLSKGSALATSLFERLQKVATIPSSLLNVQRRMDPLIAEFPNLTFYNGEIENGPTLNRNSHPVMFIDTDGSGGGEDLVGTSTRNLGESTVVKFVIDQLLSGGNTKPSEVGIIVPYLAQKGHLKRIISGVQIDTVEGFQGHEKDYIVISTVRSNAVGALGFLSDDRRMNVMLTRARKGLIVIGDKQTLTRRGHTWTEWVKWCESKKFIIPVQKVLASR